MNRNLSVEAATINAERALKDLQAAQQRENAANMFGTDAEYEVETVIVFERTFGGRFKYTYAAIKVKEHNGWYITGRTQVGGMSFKDLVEDWLVLADEEGCPIWMGTDYVNLVNVED